MVAVQIAALTALLGVAQPAQTATGIPLDAPWKVTMGMAAFRA